ncbi:MAG: copper resistance D family protein [Hyphomicrobiales bacterium]
MADLTQWDYAAILVKLAVYACSFLAMGSVLFILANPKLGGAIKAKLRKIVLACVTFGFFASALQFGIQSGRLLDDGFIGMIDPEMIGLVRSAPLGNAIMLRVVGLLLLLLSVLRTPTPPIIAIIGACTVAISFSMVGHGTQEPRWLMGSLVSIHMLAASFWIGALWPLYSAASGAISLKDSGLLAHRFGRQAAWVVGLLILAGLLLTYNLVGSITLMWSSQYGNTLLLKLGLVTALLGLAAGNKLKLVPAMLANKQIAAARLKKSIKWEGVIIILILSVTVILTTVTALPDS